MNVEARGRVFDVHGARIIHAADVELDTDEQVTFVSRTGSEFDVARKAWGYYATPSLNKRLPDHRLRPVLTMNPDNKMALLLVEIGHEAAFEEYMTSQGMRVVWWLDTDEQVDELERRLCG